MQGLIQLLLIFGAVELGDGDGGSCGQAAEEPYHEVDKAAGRAADCCQCLFIGKSSYYQGVYCIIKLLEEGADQYGEEENQNLLPNHTLCDVIFFLIHAKIKRNL